MVRLLEPTASNTQLTRKAGGAAQSIAQAGSAFRSIAGTADVVGNIASEEADFQQRKMKKLQEESDKRDADSYVNTSLADFNIAQREAFNERKVSGEDITTFTKNTNDGFNKSFQALLEKAPNQVAKDGLMAQKETLRQRQVIKAADYESTQKIEVAKTKADDALDRYVNYVNTNPDELEDVLADAEKYINSFGGETKDGVVSLGVFTPEEKAQRIESIRNDMTQTAVDAFITTEQPNKAIALMQTDAAKGLEPNDYVRLGDEIIELNQKKIGEVYMNNVFTGDAAYDSKNKESQEAYNDWFKKFGATMNENQIIDMVAETGSMPDLLLTEVRGSLANGSIEQKQKAANLIESFTRQNNNAMFNLTEKEIASATEIYSLTNAGLSKDEIESHLAKKGNPDFEAMKTTTDYKDLSNFDGKVKDYFDTSSMPWGESEIPAGMQAEHKRLAQFYFLNHELSADDAKKAAATQMMKDGWGESNINGVNRWQRLSPERMHANSIDPTGEWINTSLMDSLEGKLSESELETVFLEVAQSEINKPDPAYNIFYRDSSGLLKQMKSEEGLSMYFNPDITEYLRSEKRKGEKADMLTYIEEKTERRVFDAHMLNMPQWYQDMMKIDKSEGFRIPEGVQNKKDWMDKFGDRFQDGFGEVVKMTLGEGDAT